MATAQTVRDLTVGVLRIPVEELAEHLFPLEAELAGGGDRYGASALGTFDDRLRRAAQAAGLGILP